MSEIEQKGNKEKDEKEATQVSDIDEDLESKEVKLIEDKKLKFLEHYSKEEDQKKIEKLEKSIKEKEEEIKDLELWKNKYMLLQAEFENAQKRWEKHRADLRTEYIASVLKSFLPLYDSYKKALESDPKNDSIKQFNAQLLNIFKGFKAEPIEVKINDKFDYSKHEALTSLEKEDLPENSIVDIIQDGWKLDKGVLRYTKVVISKKPKPPEPQTDTIPESESS